MGKVTMLVRPALVVLLVVAVLLVALWLGQRRLIYFPDAARPAVAAGAVREVTLDTSDGLKLAAWLVPAADGDTKPRGDTKPGGDTGYAVLVSPGNAGNRGDRLPLARTLARAGLTVLLLEYRGYGGNPGGPTEKGLARDVRAAQAYLTGVAGFAPGRILYFGESLGAAVVADLATERPPAGLVLRSPFTDLASVGGAHYPWLPVRLLLRDRYPVVEHVAKIDVPTVVVYGTADSVVPAEQSRTVAERAAGPTRVVVVDGADHNDAALVDGPAVIGAVLDLVTKL